MSDLVSGSTPTKFNHLRGPVLTLTSHEGDVTRTENVVTTGSGAMEPWILEWVKQLYGGESVKMDGELAVIEADAADEHLVGFVQEAPRWFGVGELPWKTPGTSTPTDFRHVPVEIHGQFVREVDIGATVPVNALAVGDSVTKDSATQHAFTQHETAGTKKLNHTFVVKSGVPSAKAVVIFGYTGDTGVEL